MDTTDEIFQHPIRFEASVDIAESEAGKFGAGHLASAIAEALDRQKVPVDKRNFHVSDRSGDSE
jgi:hypothetical protein